MVQYLRRGSIIEESLEGVVQRVITERKIQLKKRKLTPQQQSEIVKAFGRSCASSESVTVENETVENKKVESMTVRSFCRTLLGKTGPVAFEHSKGGR